MHLSILLRDLSASRVHLQPQEFMNQSEIETRLEMRLRIRLMSNVPSEVSQQCIHQPDKTCAHVLYRTMILAAPASTEYRAATHDLLTKPRVVELDKLGNHYFDGSLQDTS